MPGSVALTESPGPEATSNSLLLPLPDRPSIAVLPFQNLSGDPEQDYFADGIVEDIITALSRMRWLFVIARNSSFTYKGRTVDVKQVGRELGVRYVLEGSVRKAANRVRITGQLIDAATGVHLWAERFDGMIEDIFDLQDQVTASVVGAIAPKLEQAEIDRAKRKPTESLDAYDYFLRGMASFYQRAEEANDEALRLFSKSDRTRSRFRLGLRHGRVVLRLAQDQRLDDRPRPGNRRKAHGWLGGRWNWARMMRSRSRGVDMRLAFSSATSIAAWPSSIGRSCSIQTWRRRGILSGWLRAYRGEPDVAIEHLARAMRLSPLDPTLYHMQVGTGFAHLLAGRFDEASSWAEKAFREEPNYLPAIAVTAASHALAGRLEEARQAMERLRQINPALRVSTFTGLFRRPEHFALWADGLRKAGLPESSQSRLGTRRKLLALQRVRQLLGVEPTRVGPAGSAEIDPNVWSGRASQEVSSIWFSVLHQCIRPLIGAVHCSGPPWISARGRSH